MKTLDTHTITWLEERRNQDANAKMRRRHTDEVGSEEIKDMEVSLDFRFGLGLGFDSAIYPLVWIE